MTAFIPLVCSVVAVAAAVRSTWSPCGLSMLSTITPFGERAKGHSYGATSAWFVAGATAGGATLGLLMAVSALVVRELHPTDAVVGVVALAAGLLAMASDAGVAGFRLPIHRRQVNERWLDHFRPSVYGIGFGWQIGTGLATYITTAAVYLMIVLGALTGRPAVALTVGIGFGLLRGTAVLLTRRLVDPPGLRAFHRRFFAAGPVVGRVVLVAEMGSAFAIAGWLVGLASTGAALDLIVAVSVAIVTVAVAVTMVRTTRRSGHEAPAGHAAQAPESPEAPKSPDGPGRPLAGVSLGRRS